MLSITAPGGKSDTVFSCCADFCNAGKGGLSLLFTQTKRGREKHFVHLCLKHRDDVFHALKGAFLYSRRKPQFYYFAYIPPDGRTDPDSWLFVRHCGHYTRLSSLNTPPSLLRPKIQLHCSRESSVCIGEVFSHSSTISK